ncbi:hypothetical protein [Natronobacterium texcoconense]|uniref:ParB-like nuclease domain-containing protein n=1 Tax=Natronobacterium texcoconense TaxID=1095778 RepID=A0A1H1GG85_NATTX|nr:hypothetical protein [Natronobacterium texcoconense]SDR12322.1 hypothetical protein SAMN04489842_2422 [Natronobacterium texcoconense]
MNLCKRGRLFWVKGWGLPRRKIDELGQQRVLELAHATKARLRPDKYTPISPYRYIKIKPSRVSYVQTLPVNHPLAEHRGRFYKYSPGRIISGEWDQKITPIEKVPLFTGLREHFVEGKDWEETILHPERYEIDHPNLSERYHEYTLDEFHERCEYLDELYYSLQESGYVVPDKRSALDELAVNVGRNGQFIRNSEGIHRLVLAKLLDLDHIFARIHVVHPEVVTESQSNLQTKPG